MQEFAAHHASGVSKQQADLSGFCPIGFGILHQYIEMNLRLHVSRVY
jgi:hypothetical protein